MIVLGLTGSIGMGKSTTAEMFRDLGIPVYDSDATVHDLYENEAVDIVERLFPGSTHDGKVDRKELGRQVLGSTEKLRLLEEAIHPLVRRREGRFLDRARKKGAEFVVLDIPLLFETGGQDRVDRVVVVTTTPAEQRRRVLARPDMTEEKFSSILARQTPDAEKRKRADYLVDTTHGLDSARRQVEEIVKAIRAESTRQDGGNA